MMIHRIFTILFSASVVWGNDSSYFANGDHLVPLQETAISVKKEVLTIRRTNEDQVAVTVEYTFHNPEKAEKKLLMGFEAGSPSGDVDGTPGKTGHPYIKNFSVVMNQKPLAHEVAIFDLDEKELPKQFTHELLAQNRKLPIVSDINVTNFHYVYHFSAAFQPGDNVVKHTYEYAISGSVVTEAEIDYLLTPALRWANGKIDDFTLIVDMGERREFHLKPTFFDLAQDWQCEGKVKVAMEQVRNAMSGETSEMLTVWQHHGSIRFHAKDFKPAGEFHLLANHLYSDSQKIDVTKMRLPLRGHFSFNDECYFADEFSRKALRNLPYAQRGYVFKDQKLKDFYVKQPWYMPNEQLGDVTLSEDDKIWIEGLKYVPTGKEGE